MHLSCGQACCFFNHITALSSCYQVSHISHWTLKCQYDRLTILVAEVCMTEDWRFVFLMCVCANVSLSQHNGHRARATFHKLYTMTLERETDNWNPSLAKRVFFRSTKLCITDDNWVARVPLLVFFIDCLSLLHMLRNLTQRVTGNESMS